MKRTQNPPEPGGEGRRVAVILGSDSDLPVAEKAMDVLRRLGVAFDVEVMSAHRSPERVAAFARGARSRGFGVLIAVAGKAAHLAGVLAAWSRLPVVGVPVSASLDGLDALLSTVQMPPGVPVATVGIDAGANAAWLAARILALSDGALAEALEREAQAMAQAVEERGLALKRTLEARA